MAMPTSKPATTEELLQSQVILTEALIRVLERTGLVSKQDILDEVGKIKEEMAKKRDGN
jgi:hypothetical protein